MLNSATELLNESSSFCKLAKPPILISSRTRRNNQLKFGFDSRKLNDTFGECGRPKIGWQIDPFGHSRESASLMAQIGFDGLFFARLDYQDKNKRLQTKTMEMIWEGSSDLGEFLITWGFLRFKPKNLTLISLRTGSDGDVLTGALLNHYSTPGGFCWDIFCGDEPIIDNPDLPDFNVGNRVDAFINTARSQSQYFQSNNIMMTFGDDFQYQYAHKNFKNIDKLIRYLFRSIIWYSPHESLIVGNHSDPLSQIL